MRKYRKNYNESRDQSVPFALPALKSYKQNLLFPDTITKKGLTNDIFFGFISEKPPSPSKESTKINKVNHSKLPNSNISPSRGIKPQLKSMLPNKHILQQAQLPSKKPSVSSKHIDNLGRTLRHPRKGEKPLAHSDASNDTIRNPLKTAEKPEKFERNSKNLIKKPITARVPLRNLVEAPRHQTPQSYQDNIRSNSLSSTNSFLTQNLLPKTSQRNSLSSKHGLHETTLKSEVIPEYPSKKLSRVSETRSVSRKRPKKRQIDSFFDIDFGSYKMSDLSIYPLL